jgi:hypothetical protein
MRSATSVISLFFAVACGNYSNEDVVFTEAVPQSESLRIALPQNATAPMGCPHPSDLWAWALTSGSYLNLSVDNLLVWLDVARSTSPSQRSQDARVWGPWKDENHPGFQGQLFVGLQPDADAGIPVFGFVLAERRIGDPNWTDLIDGRFVGAEASQGSGGFAMHFGAARALGINKPTDPMGDLQVSYNLGTQPQIIGLDLQDAAITDPLPPFAYQFESDADGGGTFAFAWYNADAGTELFATANFRADGSGGGSYAEGGLQIDECWDATACMDYLTVPGVFRSCGTQLTACMGAPNPASCPPGTP